MFQNKFIDLFGKINTHKKGCTLNVRNFGYFETERIPKIGSRLLVFIEKQSLLTSSRENIPATCHEIVEGFDADLIEKDRKLWKMLWEPLLKHPEFPVPGQKQE